MKMNLVRRLVDLTERSAATRDLCLAIEQEDRELVETLLAAGICCEFEESDWPSPEPGDDCTSWDAGLLRESGLTPPLARGVRLGSGELVRLLLAHGANANVAYYDLCCHHPRQHDHGLWLAARSRNLLRTARAAGHGAWLRRHCRATHRRARDADIYLPQPTLTLKRNTGRAICTVVPL
ncbi:hypothetical protein HC256_006239 [Beauveria bassiana]|nr:hypothetical protein HC256_006239 [Beauveria bassiana]